MERIIDISTTLNVHGILTKAESIKNEDKY